MKDAYIRKQKFPIEAFPALIRDAIQEVESNIQAPIALIASSALGAMSLVCQEYVNVLRPNMTDPTPISLFLLVIAESGERKTSADKLFTRVIFDYEREQENIYQQKKMEYDAAMYLWNASKKAIHASIKKMSKGESADLLQQELITHASSEPIMPKKKKMIYVDATPEAIVRGLFEHGRSAGILSDEAGNIFKGRAASSLPLLNKIWEGATHKVERRVSESFSIHNPRLTMSLMGQEKIVKKFIQRHGEESRDIGFLARTLICFPSSTQGSRQIENKTPSWEHLPKFQKRMADILNMERIDGSSEAVKFSPEAAAFWIDTFNSVEADMQPGCYFAKIKDYASKYAENLARLAAVLHFFGGDVGDISLETIRGAEKICAWYADEFKQLFSPKPEIPIEELDGSELTRWLQHNVWDKGMNWIRKNEILKYGSNALRNKERLGAALEYLEFQRRVDVSIERKVNYVNLNPNYFNRRF